MSVKGRMHCIKSTTVVSYIGDTAAVCNLFGFRDDSLEELSRCLWVLKGETPASRNTGCSELFNSRRSPREAVGFGAVQTGGKQCCLPVTLCLQGKNTRCFVKSNAGKGTIRTRSKHGQNSRRLGLDCPPLRPSIALQLVRFHGIGFPIVHSFSIV